MAVRCVIYSRVSTDAQERDGTSLDSQERAGIDLAVQRGWTVVRCIRDAASGFHLDRPGVDELRRMLQQGDVDVVIAYAVDRLSRNQNHIGVLFDDVEQVGARLEFVTERFEDTAVGRFILAARAFIAEVEREKIAERTMRGKAERARGGRLPQGTGRGIFGYQYDPTTGTRSVDGQQAQIVLRIFESFADGRSCNGIANDLNADLIPAFGGGRWYPLTVRRILMNETYTGRTIYRRTKVTKVRDAARNRWVRRVTERGENDWIEVEGATPAIIPQSLFDRVQDRIEDPERKKRGRATFDYPLRGRMRCPACDSAMVGQTLMKGRYRYYRCRRSYAGPRADRCASPYVPKGPLEDAVQAALVGVISEPRILMAELRAQCHEEPTDDRASNLDREIGEVEAKQRRLVKLFTSGELPETLLEAESRSLAEQRARLELERGRLQTERRAGLDLDRVERRLPEVLEALGRWCASEGEDRLRLLVTALDVRLKASREMVEISGSVPLIDSSDHTDLVTIERTWA